MPHLSAPKTVCSRLVSGFPGGNWTVKPEALNDITVDLLHGMDLLFLLHSLRQDGDAQFMPRLNHGAQNRHSLPCPAAFYQTLVQLNAIYRIFQQIIKGSKALPEVIQRNADPYCFRSTMLCWICRLWPLPHFRSVQRSAVPGGRYRSKISLHRATKISASKVSREKLQDTKNWSDPSPVQIV